MNVPFSSNTIYKIDAILYKEHDLLKEAKEFSKKCTHKEENNTLLSSTNAFNRVSPILHHSRRNSNYGERSHHVTFKEIEQVFNEEKSDPNLKMQKEILKLQSQVLELETKISMITSPNSQGFAKTSLDSCNNLSSTNDTRRINSMHLSSETVMLDQSRQNAPKLMTSSFLGQDRLEPLRSSPEASSQILVEFPMRTSTQTARRSPINQVLNRGSSPVYKNNRYANTYLLPESKLLTLLRESSNEKVNRETYKEYKREDLRLHKQLKILREQYKNDKSELIKERIKGNKLAEELTKVQKKLSKMNKTIQAASKIQNNFQDLMESVGNSEVIRKQQRLLIASLNNEINLLKGGDCHLNELAFSKELIVKKSKKTNFKKKVDKIF